MPTKVQIHDRHRNNRNVEADTQDSATSAHARVGLKFAASAYHEARTGADAGERLVEMSLIVLRAKAIYYYSTLPGCPYDLSRVQDRQDVEPGSPLDMLIANLQVRALGYASTRHGIDAHVEYNKFALAELCQAAVHFAQALAKQCTEASHSSYGDTRKPDDKDRTSRGAMFKLASLHATT